MASGDSARTPPSEEEQRGYYYGLPSQPKLIARSSTDEWRFRQSRWSVGKLLEPVGRHKIVGLWNDSTGPLRHDILAAIELDSLKWTSIDILRIGYEQHDDFPTPQYPVTFFISVEKDSTPWSVGQATVMRCHQILRQHGIDDVHVEMKESHVARLAPALTAPPSVPKLSAEVDEDPIEIAALNSEFLGQCIASSSSPTKEGTNCLYLRDKDTDKVLLLTCRHVVIANENAATISGSGCTILQPGDDTLASKKNSLLAKIREDAQEVEKDEQWQAITQRPLKHYTIMLKSQIAMHQEVVQTLSQLEDPLTRTIGHVLFSPKFGTGVTERGGQRVRDWALIELHQSKYRTTLGMLKNQVAIWSSPKQEIKEAGQREFGNSYGSFKFDGSRAVLLSGTIPESEMYNERLQDEAASLGAGAIFVIKYGRTTGFTAGLANQVKSLLRQPVDGYSAVSEDWCILGPRPPRGGRRVDFSAPGDSGACVWDRNGRIGGMITAGSGNESNGGYDTTYATPIGWLLEDIRAHGFNVEIL